MPNIAVIDDRLDWRETAVGSLSLNVPDGWAVIAAEPFESEVEYLGWIDEEDVAVLVVDEQLGETPTSRGSAVRYRGQDVIRVIRQARPEFPVFLVSAFTEDGGMEDETGQADGVFNKDMLSKHIARDTSRMVRSGMRYHEVHKGKLERLSLLAGRVARGEAAESEVNELRTLQTYLNFTVVPEGEVDRSAALTDLEDALKRLRSTLARLDETLQEGK